MKKNLILTACILFVLFSACKREVSDSFILYGNDPLNDTIWVRTVPGASPINSVPQLLLPQIHADSLDCSKNDTLRFGDSLEVSFTAGACVDGANVETGKVKVEIFRLKTKGDFIKFFKPTTSNGYLLETGGGFFVRITKNGRDLGLASGATIKIRYSDIEDPKPNMQVFYARESIPFLTQGIDTVHTWNRDTDTTWLKTWQKVTAGTTPIVQNGYELTAKKTRWISAERFIDSTLPKTKITAVLPPNFTNKNTAVFAVFANRRIVVGLGPDYPSRSFAALNIPIGSKITLVSVTRIGADLYLGSKVINDVGTVTHYVVTPEKKPLLDIVSYLNAL